MACAFRLINVLAALDGREGIAILVFLFLDAYMDIVFKLWNVFVQTWVKSFVGRKAIFLLILMNKYTITFIYKRYWPPSNI